MARLLLQWPTERDAALGQGLQEHYRGPASQVLENYSTGSRTTCAIKTLSSEGPARGRPGRGHAEIRLSRNPSLASTTRLAYDFGQTGGPQEEAMQTPGTSHADCQHSRRANHYKAFDSRHVTHTHTHTQTLSLSLSLSCGCGTVCIIRVTRTCKA